MSDQRIADPQALLAEATLAGDRKQLEIDRARGRIAALEAAVSELRADYTISHAMHGEETIAAWLDRVLACVAPAPIVKHAEHDPLGYLHDAGTLDLGTATLEAVARAALLHVADYLNERDYRNLAIPIEAMADDPAAIAAVVAAGKEGA